MDPKYAVLTYHRITDQLAGRQFYDIPKPLFETHTDQVAAQMRTAGVREITPIITFDDGTADHRYAATELSRVGLTGIFFVIVRRVGLRGYLSMSDIQEMSSLGHTIGSHTLSHRRLSSLSETEQYEEIVSSRDWIEQLLGSKVEWFAPPGGVIDRTGLKLVEAAGYRNMRDMKWGYTAKDSQPGLMNVFKTIPVLPTVDRRQLAKVLDGNAMFLGYRIKQAFKRSLGERVYVELRDALMKLRRTRNS